MHQKLEQIDRDLLKYKAEVTCRPPLVDGALVRPDTRILSARVRVVNLGVCCALSLRLYGSLAPDASLWWQWKKNPRNNMAKTRCMNLLKQKKA